MAPLKYTLFVRPRPDGRHELRINTFSPSGLMIESKMVMLSKEESEKWAERILNGEGG